MAKLAVDVVLLPPNEINNQAILINKSLNPKEGEVVFENGDMLPHISLLMGVLDASRQKDAETLIKNVSKKFTALPLEISGIDVVTLNNEQRASGFRIQATPVLKKLHQHLLLESEAFLGNDAEAEMFLGKPIREGSIEYTRNFRKKSSFENFHPHLTLGIGEAKTSMRFPVCFIADTIALCHLGNYNTCRKILFSAKLCN